MSALQETLIETITKDLADIEQIAPSHEKAKRKELNLLLKRIDVAKKLVASDEKLASELSVLEKKAQSLKA